MKINGLEVIADVQRVGTCPVDDIPEMITFWKMHAALARQEAARVDAEYRAWRATTTRDVLETDGKLPEWKLRAGLEGSSEFLMWKQGAGVAGLNVEICEAMAAGYQAAADILEGNVSD